MQLQKKINVIFLFVLFLLIDQSLASTQEFRTPAKRYAGGYSVKLLLKKDNIEYDIPVWIKPDQRESTLDSTLMHDLGYQNKSFVFDSVILSGAVIEKKKFKKMPSEWAFVPDFSKSCCHGVIGQDILINYEIRFEPGNPSHIKWKKLASSETTPKLTKEFENELKGLFSIKNTINVPYVLNLRSEKIIFEGEQKKHPKEIFTFSFLPPSRFLKVLKIDQKLSDNANRVGFRKGMIIKELNHKSVSGLDRWEIEEILSGEKSNSILLTLDQNREFKYDFEKNKFE